MRMTELDRSAEATELLTKGQIHIDHFSDGMKRAMELELSIYVLGALKVVTEFMKTYTRAAKEPKPRLPDTVTNTVPIAAKSGPVVVKSFEGAMKQLKDEWRDLVKR